MFLHLDRLSHINVKYCTHLIKEISSCGVFVQPPGSVKLCAHLMTTGSLNMGIVRHIVDTV